MGWFGDGDPATTSVRGGRRASGVQSSQRSPSARGNAEVAGHHDEAAAAGMSGDLEITGADGPPDALGRRAYPGGMGGGGIEGQHLEARREAPTSRRICSRRADRSALDRSS